LNEIAPPRQLKRWVPSIMDDTELDEIVKAWITGENAENKSPEYERNWWAIERVQDWSLERDTEQLWRFILAAYHRKEMSPKAGAVFAAGPIEDLLAFDGPRFIERVEELARKDPKFNWLLGGVWRSSMTEDVWHRLQSARNHVW
jgi:hypothetical protein